MRRAVLFFTVALAGAALDLLTKHLAFRDADFIRDPEAGYAAVRNPREVVWIEGFFAYGQATNPGVVFGGFAGARPLWKVVSILAVPVLVVLFFRIRKPRWIPTASLGLILAGALGNLFDRLEYGAVRDFIKFFVVVDGREKPWPLFNLADSCICVGVFLLSLELFLFDDRKRKPEPSPVPA